MVAAPFAAIIISEWLKARAEGADEGNKGVLSLARVENRFYTAILVIIVLLHASGDGQHRHAAV
ncbi:hypothetical protein Pgy4_33876 [Pseudomonas savastanoi pv. glycinea str. race 4]|uniref:Uncharacterized protein n=1 Tax=Pseudomonas savastanoi pv. glycinea str. race 4 TaxID=875330 RepID=F3CFA6_PSESG|nr:hypothetical protein Pgy4_33876 [Pseudomonas savastanoi pv. glycinea str. race 4]